MNYSRNIYFDILRCIGIICIILAHSNPPGIIFQLRNFDVVLLVIVSGYFCYRSYNKIGNSLEYIKKRFTRIVIPVWIFLIGYYFVYFIITNNQIHIKELVDSFLLGEKFGYIWIFRIYFTCSLIIPMLVTLYKKYSIKKISKIMIYCYIIYEILIVVIGKNNSFINGIIIYNIGYIFCIMLGILMNSLEEKKYIKISIINIIIFLFLMIYFYIKNNSFITTNEFKYPPQLYYFSYAIGISFFLMYSLKKSSFLFNKKNILTNTIQFIGSHTMWIYLWHIAFIKVITSTNYINNWIIVFIITFCGSTLITYFQNKIINKINSKKISMIFDC